MFVYLFTEVKLFRLQHEFKWKMIARTYAFEEPTWGKPLILVRQFAFELMVDHTWVLMRQPFFPFPRPLSTNWKNVFSIGTCCILWWLAIPKSMKQSMNQFCNFKWHYLRGIPSFLEEGQANSTSLKFCPITREIPTRGHDDTNRKSIPPRRIVPINCPVNATSTWKCDAHKHFQ